MKKNPAAFSPRGSFCLSGIIGREKNIPKVDVCPLPGSKNLSLRLHRLYDSNIRGDAPDELNIAA